MIKLFFTMHAFMLSALYVQAQSGNMPEPTTLVSIIEKGDFEKLQLLVSTLGYKVLDSSKEKNGSLFYFAKEYKFHGNTLACSTNPQLKITELTFMTFDEVVYKEYKIKFKKLGFKSSGIHNGGLPGIIESEDFEKDKILVATATRKKDNEDPLYEFTLLQW